jgi:hypothetical protein
MNEYKGITKSALQKSTDKKVGTGRDLSLLFYPYFFIRTFCNPDFMNLTANSVGGFNQIPDA